MKARRGLLILGLPVLGLAQAAFAGIVLLPGTNCLMVADYPSSAPCTPANLRSADRAHGWGKVTYDPATDTTTVEADLIIGKNDGTETFFQIGSPEHPREILQIKGNVSVQADWVRGKNEGMQWWTAPERHVNRMTLGMPGNSNIVAALKLGPQKNLCVGSPGERHGGQLYVYNSVLTAITPDASNMAGSIILIGNSIVLQDAVVSWIAGDMSSGVGPRWRGTGLVDNVVFEHGGIGLKNGNPVVTRSVFRNLKTAVLDYGALNAVLTDCVFSNNDCNWSLRFTDKGLTCVDCAWAPPHKGDEFGCRKDPKTGAMSYPCFISRRHVVVAVKDASGSPLAGAHVEVACEQSQDAGLFDNRRVATDAAGRTPAKETGQAILLTETILQSTEIPNQPQTNNFTYTLTVTATNYPPATVTGIKPVLSWQIIPVILKK